MKKKEFSKEQIEKMAFYYNIEGLSLTKVGEIFNVSKTVVTRIFKENNIQIKKDHHKYVANYRKFENIDSQASHNDKNNYYIRCGGIQKPYLIMKKLYNSCPICLERKFNVYKDLETVVLSRNVK